MDATVRDVGIDVGRGVAIVAVVGGHTLLGLHVAGIEPGGEALALDIVRFVYLWHVPVFCFLAGLFIPASLSRVGAPGYLRRRVVELAYLYLVWTVIMGLAAVLVGDAKNLRRPWWSPVLIWQPQGHLWFLPLFAIGVLVVTAVRAQPVGLRVACLVAFIGLALAAWGVEIPLIGGSGVAMLAFLLAGGLVGARRWNELTVARSAWTLGCVAGLGIMGAALAAWGTRATLATTADAERTPQTIALGVLGTLLGAAGVLAASVLIGRWPTIARPLAYLGQFSLAIYLAHILFTAGARIVLLRLRVDDPWWHLGAGVIAGVLGPLVLVRLAPGFPLFGLPGRARQRAEPRHRDA